MSMDPPSDADPEFIDLFNDRQSLKATSVEELKEQAEAVGYLTVLEYAKMIGKRPQQVYGWIKKGFIKIELCKCGRRVINVEQARLALQKRAEATGRYVDASFDPRYKKGPESE